MSEIMVSWGPSMAEQSSVTPAQMAALRAVREAAKKTSGVCFVSNKTETWFDHKTTVNVLAAKALERIGLVEILTEWTANYYSSKVRLTDRGAISRHGTRPRRNRRLLDRREQPIHALCTRGSTGETMKRKPRPRNTKWHPTTWERQYRGLALWVEEMFTAAPKWNWQTEDGGEGRARTRQQAMLAAVKSIDAALTKGVIR